MALCGFVLACATPDDVQPELFSIEWSRDALIGAWSNTRVDEDGNREPFGVAWFADPADGAGLCTDQRRIVPVAREWQLTLGEDGVLLLEQELFVGPRRWTVTVTWLNEDRVRLEYESGAADALVRVSNDHWCNEAWRRYVENREPGGDD